MEQDKPVIDAEFTTLQENGRRGDGGTYLVVADNSDEFTVALRYACFIARKNRAHVGILCIIANDDFQQWGAVEHRMMKELRLEAEKYIWGAAKAAHDYHGTVPSLYFAEGDKHDELVRVIDENPDIVQLILGGGADQSNRGPLISYFLGKGLSRLRVPVVIVPGHIEEFS